MKTIAIINLKGGVGKTTTAANLGHILATRHNKRVLLVDNDKQGNLTQFYGPYMRPETPTISNLIAEPKEDITMVIQPTDFWRLDIIPATIDLSAAAEGLQRGTEGNEHTRLAEEMRTISDYYDYCIIDNAPDVGILVLNALMAADEVIVPVKIDGFSAGGAEELHEQIKHMRDINKRLKFAGCLITQYTRSETCLLGAQWLQSPNSGIPTYKTIIRRSERANDSTVEGIPIMDFSPRSGTARDYKRFAEEYLGLL